MTKTIKLSGITSVKKLLEKRLKEVGAVRDRLRADISELEYLKQTCDTAYEDLEHAIQSLSELA